MIHSLRDSLRARNIQLNHTKNVPHSRLLLDVVLTCILLAVAGPVLARPIVRITAPANNTVYTAPATFPVQVYTEPGDPGISSESVTSVVLYQDGAVLDSRPGGGQNATTYTFNVANLAAGTHTYFAKAFASAGSTTTGTRAVIVDAPPSVGISSPASGTVGSAPANFTFTASAADSDGSISSVQYYANGSPIGGALTTAPYSYTWAGVGGGTYSITATATDNLGVVTMSPAISVIANGLPSVSITSPASGTVVTAPASFTFTANAVDSDGSISAVAYYANGSYISASSIAPYSIAWNGVGAGTYTITAVATDNRGGQFTSAPITVIANALPNITLTAPANGAVYAPGNVTLSATAADSDGSISKVEFFNGGTLLQTVTAAPYTYVWPSVPVGSYTVSARATDNRGAPSVLVSAAITVSTGNAATFVSQSVPTTMVGGQTYPVTVTMKNSGTSTWTAAGNYRLGSQNAPDNTTWGLNRVNVPASTAPGNDATFAFNVTAPATAGTYNFQWRVVQDGVEWFGAQTTNVIVTVNPASASGIVVPNSAAPVGGSLPGSVGISTSGAATYSIPIAVPPGSFVYGPEHQRVKQTQQSGTTVTRTIYYAGAIEKEVTGSTTTVKTYLPNGIGVILDTGATPQARYFHPDHLGSVSVITDQSGTVVERLQYDPWGKRRNPTGTDDTANTLAGVTDNKGYTGHEHLDNAGLIHMNGRVYDPMTARFASADPHLTDPGDGQSYNRYSYVLNNPLAYTDPTGFENEPPPELPGITVTGCGGCFQRGSGGVSASFAGREGRHALPITREERVFYTGSATARKGGTFCCLANAAILQDAGADDGEPGYFLDEAGNPNGRLERIEVTGRQFLPPGEMGNVLGDLLRWSTIDNPFFLGVGSVLKSGLARGAGLLGKGAANRVVKSWSPLTGAGPLGEKVAATFRSSTYSEVVTTETTALYRVYGGTAREIGPYWTRTPPSGALQSTIDSALNPAWGNTASRVVRIDVPAGTRIFEGVAAPQGGLVGGGNQVFIQRVDPSWVVR